MRWFAVVGFLTLVVGAYMVGWYGYPGILLDRVAVWSLDSEQDK